MASSAGLAPDAPAPHRTAAAGRIRRGNRLIAAVVAARDRVDPCVVGMMSAVGAASVAGLPWGCLRLGERRA